MAAVFSDLQEDLLECIIKSLNGDNRTFKSLTVVSKQFLSITNRVRFSVRITDETIPFLPRLFHRFPNLTSLHLTLYRLFHFDKKDLFLIADCFPLLEELNLRYPRVCGSQDFMIDENDPLLALPNLRKINLSGNHIEDQFINFLCHSCKVLQVVMIIDRIISGEPGEFGENGKYDRSDIIYL